MKPIYEKHTSAVDQIVEVGNQEAQSGEALAAKTVRFYTEVMAGVGLLIVLAGGMLSSALARGISKQTEELISSEHTYPKPGRYTVAVKVIDIFGNDTMTLVPVNVG